MKSIYDEAIEIINGTDENITQEEMLAIDNLFDVVKEECLLLLSEDEKDKVIKALEFAKKEHELLVNASIVCKHVNTLKDSIKELEEELK